MLKYQQLFFNAINRPQASNSDPNWSDNIIPSNCQGAYEIVINGQVGNQFLIGDNTEPFSIIADTQNQEPTPITIRLASYEMPIINLQVHQENKYNVDPTVITLLTEVPNAITIQEWETQMQDKFAEWANNIGNIENVMNFRGVFDTYDDVENPQHGDIILIREKTQEYIYVKPNSTIAGEWVELGDPTAIWTKIDTIDSQIGQLDQSIKNHTTEIDDINTWLGNTGTTLNRHTDEIETINTRLIWNDDFLL